MFTGLTGIPFSLRDSQIASWVNVSKALSKSIKAMNSGE
jgi:hypothetical protein